MRDAASELERLGLAPEHARVKVALYVQCESALTGAGGDAGRRALWVPGRIEVFGKHTDYAGGRSLMCAVERGLCLRAAPRHDATIRVFDVVRGESYTCRLGPSASAPQGTWGAYVAAVARRFARDLPSMRFGADIALASDLPPSAGLSSSSALVVAVALSLIAANDGGAADGSPAEWPAWFPAALDTVEALAGYLGAVENGAAFGGFPGDEGVGTFGGSEDHTAILCCRTGALSQFSYAPVLREADIPLPPGLVFAVGVSGVTASKTGNALKRYNRLSLAASRLLVRWNAEARRSDPTLAAALASAPGALERLRAVARDGGDAVFSPTELCDRLDQFAEESGLLVVAAARAFRAESWAELGSVADRSQHLAATLLGNQVPETVALQQLARANGAAASSAFGGGFGGSVWALVDSEKARAFLTNWQRAYRQSFPRAAPRSGFFLTRAGPPASKW